MVFAFPWVVFILLMLNYYVATNGDDSNSGIGMNQAWATLQKAADIMIGGDTCFVADRTYKHINIGSLFPGIYLVKAIISSQMYTLKLVEK